MCEHRARSGNSNWIETTAVTVRVSAEMVLTVAAGCRRLWLVVRWRERQVRTRSKGRHVATVSHKCWQRAGQW